ncbi:hypothetical protein OPT61_g4728 [Boeremia exigua]|uniref:Uncharacterized protein n=1 Tax=Boeremia exigua TaxID=749465 RepID=A0ACC2ID91_9PLEO|nr:hypothetical protein OPT61_g4728 [Boeremia exigua]
MLTSASIRAVLTFERILGEDLDKRTHLGDAAGDYDNRVLLMVCRARESPASANVALDDSSVGTNAGSCRGRDAEIRDVESYERGEVAHQSVERSKRREG